MQSQRAAYFKAITSVLKENKVNFEENKTVVKSVLTSEMREQVISIVCAGFKNGSISLKDTPSNREKLADAAKLKTYARGTLTNWLAKDKRLNGGVDHEIKKPGSRAGQGDKEVQNFKALQAQFAPGSKQYDIIQGKIDERKAKIAAEKAAKKHREVDYSLVPDELMKELGLDKK